MDLSYLEKFAKGNVERMNRYIGMYLESAPAILERIKTNLAEKDWEMLRINAHTLKPQADLMGLSDMKNALMEIEKEAANQNESSLQGLVIEVNRLHLASEPLLIDFLNNPEINK